MKVELTKERVEELRRQAVEGQYILPPAGSEWLNGRCHASVVLALLDRIEELEKEVADLKESAADSAFERDLERE